MKIFKKTQLIGILPALLLMASVLYSCKKGSNNDEPIAPTSPDITYAIANVGGTWPNQKTYIQGLKNLDMGTLTNDNAKETASFSSMWTYGGNVYLTPFDKPASIYKYTLDKDGKATLAGTIIVPGANTFSSVEFISATEAYASVGGGLAKVIKFNPTSFQIIGEIDLSSLADLQAGQMLYPGMKARDGKLFMGVFYGKKNGDPLYGSVSIAVIDLATGKIEKRITDNRSSGLFNSGSSTNSFVLDNNGDLYLQARGSDSKPSGILKIKKGATDFDASYFFDLNATTGKPCSNLYLFDGQAFTTRAEDPNDLYEFNGPNFRYYKIDLVAKTSLGELSTNLPTIYGSSTAIMRQSDDKKSILFVASSAKENAIYNYTIATGQINKKLALPGNQCTGFSKIN